MKAESVACLMVARPKKISCFLIPDHYYSVTDVVALPSFFYAETDIPMGYSI